MPDHNMMSLTIETPAVVMENLCGNTLGSKSVRRTCVLRKVGENYMNSALAKKMIPTLIKNIQTVEKK